MGIRATCKNCGRQGMSIVREGMCGTCASVAKENPDPADRLSALSEVRARIERGELKGPRNDGPRKTKATKDPEASCARYRTIPKEKLDSVRKGIKKRLDIGAVYPKPEEKLGPGGDLPTKSTPPRETAIKPITIQLTFSVEDVPLYHSFQDYCRRQRRDPEGQILFLIDDIVQAETVN